MDGLELRNQLMQSMALGVKTMAEERKETNGGYRYAELVGRMDTMRTVMEFLLNADIGPCANCPRDGEAKGAGVGQKLKDPGPPVDGGSEEDSSTEEGAPV